MVDDQQWLASALADRLGLDGFDTVVAGSIGQALVAFDELACDVAFLDLSLPDGNGIDLAVELKRRKPRLMVVLMTGFASASDDPTLESDSVDEILPKPWAPRELESIIKKVQGVR